MITQDAKRPNPAASSREQRELELRELWQSKSGKEQVLRMVWKHRDAESPLQAGDSIFDLILDREFGEPAAQ